MFLFLLVFHFYFWLFYQNSCLEYCAFIPKNVYPARLICQHKGPHRGRNSHVCFQVILGSKIIYSNCSFQKLSVNPERTIWRIIVIVLSMLKIMILTVFPKMGMEFLICRKMLLSSSECCPKVTVWIWVFQLISLCFNVPNTQFLLHFGGGFQNYTLYRYQFYANTQPFPPLLR